MTKSQSVAKTSDVTPGDMKLVTLDSEEVVIANADGEYFAFANTCPHAEGPLVQGELIGGIVTCLWHATPFDVKMGEAQEGGVTDDPVATYDVRIKGSDIQIAKP